MSLDVYLTVPNEQKPVSGERIFVRRDGQTVEVTPDEWHEMYPDRDPVVVTAHDEDDWGCVYEANITHNMGRMAGECGSLYEALWRPEELEAARAGQLIEPLRDGLAILQSDYDRLQEFNPKNGWGSYDGLVRFALGYLLACEKWPDAEIRVSR